MKFAATYLAVVVAFVLCSAHAGAQGPGNPTIDAVELQGLERASEQLVRSQMEVRPGQPLDNRAVARDIRRLYDLGFFTSIRVESSTVGGDFVLTYIFDEKRVIDEVNIIGNRKVKDRDIRGVLTWKQGDSFVREGYEDELSDIVDLYRSKGFLNAEVDIIVEEISPSRVRVTYSIEEGRKARIRSIDFHGNEALSDRQLRKIVKTQRAWWFIGGKYDEAKFEQDLRNIINEYGNHGRLEAEIPSTDFEYSPNGKRLHITINIIEGPEYRVDSLEIAENVVYDDDELLTSIEVQPGDVHNRGQVEDDADLVRQGYEDSGYINAQVTPQVTLDRDSKTTNIVHRVQEGELKYVRQIKITGNDVTRDEVIRRGILLNPGERYDGAAARATQNRLDATEYFDETRIARDDVPGDPRYMDLLVDVEEGRTGNFNFGGGFSTDEGLGGFLELRFNNFDIKNWPTFSGGGQQFALRFSDSETTSQYSTSFTDPEFLGYPFAFGVDLYNTSFDTRGGSDYDEDTRGGQLRLAKSLSPFNTIRTSARISSVDISDFSFFLGRELRELRDPGTTISNAWSFNRNTQDHFRDPTSGANHTFTIELAGFGGTNDFVKFDHDSTWYRALDDDNDWIFSYRTREGFATAYGDRDFVPLQDRYFAGGTTTVRGYDTRDIGPEVRRFRFFGEDQAIGGEMRLINNVELKYKATDLIRFYTFFDAGGVWKEVSDFDAGDIKYSVGIGVGVDVPRLGPLRVDYGFPLNPDDDQGSGRLHLTTGFRF